MKPLFAIAALVVTAGAIAITVQHWPSRKSAASNKTEAQAYVKPAVCAGCHQGIANTYRLTGMGRSFHRVSHGSKLSEHKLNANFHNSASGRDYMNYEHNGEWFQQRTQTGFKGSPTNIVQKRIDCVIGSGNHARTYLTRRLDGQLVELPMSWYAEKGGYYAMSPGYDRSDHSDFRRTVSRECLFCHNGYPVENGKPIAESSRPSFPAELPNGIDCQRCHGPGSAHVAAAGSAKQNQVEIRNAILNPKRLSRDRQMEVCMQCHLETTSSKLPASLRRFNRDVFSYRPQEPLANYALHFDKANDHQDRFEIAGAAYRLRQSACFRSSQMTCSTCHNPHDIPRGAQAATHYATVCRSCHTSSKHALRLPASSNCITCHMPKRRTQDAVHVVMTDHYIQRQKPAGDLLQSRAESRDEQYAGEVKPYYPDNVVDPQQAMLLAVAQVKDGANLQAGIARLEEEVSKSKATGAEILTELAQAYSKVQDQDQAIHYYDRALNMSSDYVPALKGLVVSLVSRNRLSEASQYAARLLQSQGADATLLSNLANAYLQAGDPENARLFVERALKLNEDCPEAHQISGLLSLKRNDHASAENSFREAIRMQPDLAPAHNNLAALLASLKRYPEAEFHFVQAIALNPKYTEAHHSFGLLLVLLGNTKKARSEFESAIALEPSSATLRTELADLLATQGLAQQAKQQYETAINLQPDAFDAHLGLGILLARSGDRAKAATHLNIAASSPDESVRQTAMKVLGR